MRAKNVVRIGGTGRRMSLAISLSGCQLLCDISADPRRTPRCIPQRGTGYCRQACTPFELMFAAVGEDPGHDGRSLTREYSHPHQIVTRIRSPPDELSGIKRRVGSSRSPGDEAAWRG